MTPERWKKVRAVFDAAVDQPADKRAAMLARETAGDPALRQEVESLLKACEDSSGPLDTPPVRLGELAPPSDNEDLSGSAIGHYRILRKIRASATGTLYLAERAGDLARFVIKTIPAGLDSLATRQRILHERQTLDSLDHPRIVHVVDGGTTSAGKPYLVRQYVEGIPIDTFCNQHKLSVAQRLHLAGLVCDTLAYMHENRIAQRGLASDQVLVTAQGEPMLVDLASAGTLRSAAADIRDLGALMFLLFVGRAPESAEKPSEAVASLSDDETREHLKKHLLGDIDAIILAALAGVYDSVENLGTDIRCYLENRPVKARGDSLSYRAGKLFSRLWRRL